MATFNFDFIQPLEKPLFLRTLNSLLCTDDNLNLQLNVALTKGGEDYSLDDYTVSGAVIMANGATVPLTGTHSGNVASIVLTSGCLCIVGRWSAFLRITKGSETAVVLAVTGTVVQTTTDVIYDPDKEVPSLAELLAQIQACEDATEAAQAVAGDGIATVAETKAYLGIS